MVKTLQSTFTAWISTRITPFRLKLLMYVHRTAVCTLPGTLVYIRCANSRTCVHTVVLFFPGMQWILVPIVDCFTSKCTRISMRFWMTDWFILCTACIVRTVLVLYSSKELIFSNQSGIILLFDDHGETLQSTSTAWILTRTTPIRLKLGYHYPTTAYLMSYNLHRSAWSARYATCQLMVLCEL